MAYDRGRRTIKSTSYAYYSNFPLMTKARPADAPPVDLPRWAGWALGAAMLLVYAATATTHLVGADNGEFVILAAQAGRAHPPGYPLYTLYLRSLDWLPALDAVHRASLATALLGAASVALVFQACRSWGADARAALLAALIFGLSPQVWFLHTHAEAFALNNLFAAAILWLSAPNAPLEGGTRLVALGLLAGLGLSNHHSIVLLAPLGVFGVYCGWRESTKPFPWLVLSGLALAIGLLPYAYLLSASGCVDCFQWGRIEGLGGVVDHFLRRDYGTTQLDYYGGDRKPLAHLLALVGEISADYQYVGVLVAIGGAWAMWSRPEAGGPRRPAAAALVAALVMSGPLFVMLFNRAPEGIGLEVARRFYVLPQIPMAVCLAFGLGWLYSWQKKRLESPSKVLRYAVAGLFFVMLIAASATRLAAYYQPTLENYAHNTLSSMPDEAILAGTGDARFLSIEYLRRVEAERADVSFVHSTLLRFDWYLERVEERLGVDIAHTRGESGLIEVTPSALVDALHASGRPVLWAAAPVERLDAYTLYPHGTAIRVLPAGEPMPGAEELLTRTDAIFETFRLAAPPPAKINPWGWWLYAEYPRAWRHLAQICEQQSRLECAEVASQRAREFNP